MGSEMCIRDSLRREKFLEVQTPKIIASATEGGTSLFEMKYFDKTAYLAQSPQLYKQMLMGGGLERVYEIGPAFRAEEHNTPRHLNEFISIDIEMSFADDDVVMAVEHKSLPINAVQFHPESIMSFDDEIGLRLVRNAVEILTDQT